MIMDEGKTEMGVESPEAIREQVDRWLENGLTEDSVAAFGTSIEVFLKMLHEGHVTANPTRNLEYQGAHGDGKHLYYFAPLGENLQRDNPTFYLRMLKNLEDNHKQHELDEDAIGEAWGLSMAEGYAHTQAMTEEVSQVLGRENIPDNSVIEDAVEFFKEQDEEEGDSRAKLERWSKFDRLEAHELQVRMLRERLKAKGVNPDDIGKLQGVTIFFNNEIFKDSKAMPGVEAPHEFFMVRDEPLSFSSVTGIKIPTMQERAEVAKKI